VSGTVQTGHDSGAGLENGTGPKQPGDGFIQICADAVFHLDVLKMALPRGGASDAPSDARTKEQMSPNLDDLW
jgi:hypothetical protein